MSLSLEPLDQTRGLLPPARLLFLAVIFWVFLVDGQEIFAQKPPDESANSGTYRLKIVLRLEAEKQNLARISATCPIPVDWPEQSVKLLSETKPAFCKTREQAVPGMGAVMIVQCPQLRAGQAVEIERVYELARSAVSPQLDPKTLRRPPLLPKEMRDTLRSAPGIEIDDQDLQKLADKLGRTQKPPWEFTQAAATWIRGNVQYQTGDFRGAKFALQNRRGDCEDTSALLIALCRIAQIPARTVWVEGHAYPEFYLEDGQKRGHWIPVQMHGPEAFGSIREARPILQKGDRYRDPVSKQTLRYLPQQALAFGGRAKLTVARSIWSKKSPD